MKKKIMVWLFLLGSLCVSQAGNWRPIQVLSTINGLPTNGVRQVYQDKEGYIWIATIDGLCRYDAYQLKTYKTNLYTPSLLSSNWVNTVAEDGEHRLWIGTDNGLNILNKINGEIRRVEPHKLRSNTIQCILTSRSGVWIATSNGLHRYIAESDSFICYDSQNTNHALGGNDVKTLMEDSRGNIWIGVWHGGLARFDVATDTFHAYPPINEGNSAHVIFEDNEQTVWIGSWGYGLFRLEEAYDTQKVRYINYRHQKNTPASLSDNIIYALSQDPNTNALWVGTRSGLSILQDRQEGVFTNYLPNQPGQSIIYNELNSILCDRSGLMWLGTLGGGVSLINTRETMFKQNTLEEVKNRLSSNSVRSLYIDRAGTHWLGIGSYGLVSYQPGRNRYTFYEDHPDFAAHPLRSSVYDIIQTPDSQAYWIASYGQGVFIYEPEAQGEKVRNITMATHPWLSSNSILCLKEDSQHRIWIGTSEGICSYDPQTGAGIAWPNLRKHTNGQFYIVPCIEETDEHTLWVATEALGVIRINKNPVTGDIESFSRYATENGKLNNNHIQYLYHDSRRRLWLGSKGGGLSLYDPAGDRFVCMQQAYGVSGDVVYNIMEDEHGNLWLGSNAGLSVLSFPENEAAGGRVVCRHYGVSDGLLDNSFNRNSLFKTRQGEIYIGSANGYNHFYPSQLAAERQPSPVVISDLKIFNKSLESLEGKLRAAISENAPGYTGKIQLPYDYNNFTVEFAALCYENAMQSKYAYRLSGFDKDWQYTDATRRFASYNNLPGGRYFFHLKSSDGNGLWDEAVTQLQVVILPPPWLRWWAFLLYLVAGLAAIYAGIRLAKGKLMLLNTIRIKDLEKQKTEELNHAKLQFFTNITHEFLTPLTILSASVDELKITAPQAGDLYSLMSANINRLIRLLQQILEFRKAESGNLKLRVSRGDIAAFVRSNVESFKPLMKKNKLHFSLLCDPESIPAYFDPDKLDKIIFNLLSNASKYNKPGAFIQVNLGCGEAQPNTVLLSVKDNGEGIQPQEIKGLFKRFYEGDYRRYHTTGTGIGLSLTKDLVDLHKGEIRVESQVGAGTVFYVSIPINKDAYTADEIDESTCVHPAAPHTTGAGQAGEEKEHPKKHSLLLVEDNEELLQLMVRLLGREYAIFTARNGKEGIEILEAEYIDLAISDIMMPEMDGIAFCSHVKNNFDTSHVPVILLTAKNKEEDRIDAYDSGADGFISKPFNLNVLHSKIRNLLKTKERTALLFKKQFVADTKLMNVADTEEHFLKRAIACVHEHINQPDFDQQQFAEALGTSKSTLYKKLKSLTGLNSSSFIRNIRLKTACRLIEEKKKIRISELAYAVGFNDPKYFSVCFKKEFGLIPSEYLEKILAGETMS
ncbi:MAG: response regulator [Tannerellaceae bacterium]|nr:response regulator [Tannerellaceae bacterium]